MDNAAAAAVLDFRALVVDDEAPLADVVASYLKRELFEVHLAHDGHGALTLAREVDPDVVILDIGLPGVDGIEVCRQLRVFSDAYVIMLTARDTEVDTIVGLSVGADDYVTKPFSPRELVARVRAVLRRPRRTPTHGWDPGQELSPPRRFGALRINIDSREVHIGDTPIMLTRTEFDVLAALSSRPGWATTTSSMSTLGTCDASWATTPPCRGMSPLCAASGIAWARGDGAFATPDAGPWHPDAALGR